MTVLLVRVECLCGAIAAIPEGGLFPLCGRCGRRMVCPLRGGPGDINNTWAYIAKMTPESDAAHLPREIPNAAEFDAGRQRKYSDEHLREALEHRGWPVDPQPWAAHPSPDGGSYTAPPWEHVA